MIKGRLRSFVLVTLAGCSAAPEEQSHLFGALDGERFTLRPTGERRFRALLCRDAPDEAELDLRLGADADALEPTELLVAITTPEEERRELVTVEGPTRIDVVGLAPVLDPEAPCLEGIPIRFELGASAAAEVSVEWALHFGVRADEEIVGAENVLVEDP